MPTFGIGARTLPAGETVLGPFTLPTKWTQATLTFDVSNVVQTLWLTLDWSPDGGVSWRQLAVGDFNGPAVNPRTGLVETMASFWVQLAVSPGGSAPRTRARFLTPAAVLIPSASVTVV